ncbi:hypothetical protein MMC08_002637 [Hypocenomyce scalaris]|nr:hypothetical protein [Hypocenomyce scalaris]
MAVQTSEEQQDAFDEESMSVQKESMVQTSEEQQDVFVFDKELTPVHQQNEELGEHAVQFIKVVISTLNPMGSST